MKILNINSYYYSSSVHINLQNAIKASDIDLVSYVPLSKGYIPRDECQFDNEFHIVNSFCYNNHDRYIFSLKHSKILKDIVQKIDIGKFDCLHAHSLFSNGYIAMKMKEKFGRPYIVAVRDTDLNIFFKKMAHLRPLGIKILKEADKIVFLSKPYRDILIQKYVPNKIRKEIYDKSEIIPNGIDKYWFNNKGVERQLNSKKTIKILHVGTISKRKNLIITTKSIDTLRDKGYDIIYTAVGKIVDVSAYEKLKKLSYINFVQPVSKKELLDIYRNNDIFVVPSKTETFGLVYAEAMSQGLPVIYTEGQGFDGHFKDGLIGYNVPSDNYKKIAENIIKIIDNYEVISKNCIQLFHQFDWDDIAKKYINLYQKVKNRN